MTNNPLVEALREAMRKAERSMYRGKESVDHDAMQRFNGMIWANRKAILAALASSAPATGEREQIVTWLEGVEVQKDTRALYACNYARELAAKIKNGDHLTQSGEMEGGEHG